MANLSTYVFSGRLTKDATIKDINGNTLVEMSVAVNTGFGDYAKTQYVTVEWWGDRAANAAPIFTKGSLVSGQGEPSCNAYVAKDGSAKAVFKVKVFGLNLESKPKTDSVANAAPADIPEDVVF